ncbi:nucleotidyltransferase family protein [Cytophaga aurantiaca]|uniref:nucleotidyltransferase family protein n=1 Tax=Cytophaga aurantiaca TaxID=29530 RepID=UPI0003829104|nr:nucleotidyltransferase family protein [Cytophaga aurantiaca]
MSHSTQFDKYLINESSTIFQGLEKLNTNESLTLFVQNENGKIVGSLTDGDFRRGILKGISLEENIKKIMHDNFLYLKQNKPDLQLIDKARKSSIRLLPILDENYFLNHVLDLKKQKSMLPIEAVLMAGGRGERLRPLTDTTPKPLLKLGDKAIIEYNINNLTAFGVKQVYISVKYLAEKIESYLGDGSKYNLTINYLKEEKPLGTLGSVSLVNEFHTDSVLVMNSDLFTNLNLEEFYNHFIESGASMAIATFPYVVSVPYGVLDTAHSEVVSFLEKPTYTYQASAGIYLIKKDVLKDVPTDTFFNATDLMDLLISKNKKITYFPIVGYWIDIGKPDDYKKAQEYVKYLNV